jgi:DNA-binding MarR family transcriptional regulator
LSSDLIFHPEDAAGPPLIGALLRMPVDAVRERILAGLHEDGFTDLNAAHLTLLRYPGPENRRPSELATEARVTKQAMNYLLGELERLGYLSRRDDPEDRRSKRVHLTERGHAVVRTIRGTVGRIEAEWEDELGPARFATLRGLLIDLNATGIVRELHRERGGTLRSRRPPG